MSCPACAVKVTLLEAFRQELRAIREEEDWRVVPLSHAAKQIGISPSLAQVYKKNGLLDEVIDHIGHIRAHDLRRVHLSRPRKRAPSQNFTPVLRLNQEVPPV